VKLNYYKYIFTDAPEKELNERHIFNLFVFLVSFLFYVATLFNIVVDLGIVTFVSLSGALVISVIYFLSRFYVYNQKLIILFIVFSILALNGLFITNFGFKGPIVYNFMTLGMAILFFLKKRSRIFFIIALCTNLTLLGFVEYYFPNLFGFYENNTIRILDHVTNLLFSISTLALLYYLMIQYIEKQKLKAEESDRIKSSFLANMSHEIRTPLNGIVGFSSLLNEDNISTEEQNHFIEIIQSNSSHLEGLINDLIDISIIEANALSLSFSPINLHSFLNQSLKLFNHIVVARQKEIKIYLSQGLSIEDSTIFVDKIRLNQILNNLVLNAINYSESDSIHLGFVLESNEKHIRFFVKDQGIGIKSEDQELIFKPFIKAKNAKFVSKSSGTGIGLSIAIKLVELMGGKMWLESSENKGSNFYFTIPYYKNPTDIPSDNILKLKH
jgi:signal transduction histidine kinase